MKKAILLGIGGYIAYRMVRKSLNNKESMLSCCVKKAAGFLTNLTETSAVSSVVSAATDGMNKVMHMGKEIKQEGENLMSQGRDSDKLGRKEEDKSAPRGMSGLGQVSHN